MMTMSNLKVASKFLRHTSCDHCGSSDGSSIYDDDDAHTYCHRCQKYKKEDNETTIVPKQQTTKVFTMKTQGEVKAIVDRGIVKGNL